MSELNPNVQNYIDLIRTRIPKGADNVQLLLVQPRGNVLVVIPKDDISDLSEWLFVIKIQNRDIAVPGSTTKCTDLGCYGVHELERQLQDIDHLSRDYTMLPHRKVATLPWDYSPPIPVHNRFSFLYDSPYIRKEATRDAVIQAVDHRLHVMHLALMSKDWKAEDEMDLRSEEGVHLESIGFAFILTSVSVFSNRHLAVESQPIVGIWKRLERALLWRRLQHLSKTALIRQACSSGSCKVQRIIVGDILDPQLKLHVMTVFPLTHVVFCVAFEYAASVLRRRENCIVYHGLVYFSLPRLPSVLMGILWQHFSEDMLTASIINTQGKVQQENMKQIIFGLVIPRLKAYNESCNPASTSIPKSLTFNPNTMKPCIRAIYDKATNLSNPKHLRNMDRMVLSRFLSLCGWSTDQIVAKCRPKLKIAYQGIAASDAAERELRQTATAVQKRVTSSAFNCSKMQQCNLCPESTRLGSGILAVQHCHGCNSSSATLSPFVSK
jgi:hypothetical protein